MYNFDGRDAVGDMSNSSGEFSPHQMVAGDEPLNWSLIENKDLCRWRHSNAM